VFPERASSKRKVQKVLEVNLCGEKYFVGYQMGGGDMIILPVKLEGNMTKIADQNT